MASEAFFGSKNRSLCFSLGMVTKFASRPHAWRLVSISIGAFRYISGTGRRRGTRKPVNILLLWILFRAMPVNVWPSYSQSARSQVSAVLFYARTMKFIWAQICIGDTRVSHLQAKGWQHHLSQNIVLMIAGPAIPALPALSENNECIK